MTYHPFVIRNNIPPPPGYPPNIDSHLYISIAKRPSLTILPDVHMYKAVSSNFRVALVGSFSKKKCGDGNRCLVGVFFPCVFP
jgi:hypothetical protein